MKFPTMRLVEDFKIFQIFLTACLPAWSACLPACRTACQPAVRPTSTWSMAPDFSHNKGNRVHFTKLFR